MIQKIFCILFFCGFSIQAEEWILHSYRNPISLSREGQNIPTARGIELQNSMEVLLGFQGVSTWDQQNGSTFSTQGPALLKTILSDGGLDFKLEYGELYLRVSKSVDSFFLECDSRKMKIKPGTEIYITKRAQSESFEVLNLGSVEVAFEEGLKIAPSQWFSIKESKFDSEVVSDKKIRTERARLMSLRHLKDFYSADSRSKDVKEAENISRFIEGGVIFGFTRLSPAADSTFVQDLGGMGAFIKKGNNSYFKLPSDPTAITRDHYLYSASLRWGWGLHFLSYWIEPIAEYRMKSQSLGAAVFGGWGWEALSLDVLGGYAIDLNPALKKGFKLKWPIFLGLDANYRIDISKLMDMEAGLDVGFRYSMHFMNRNSSVSSTSASAVSPQSFRAGSYMVQTALSFRY